MGDSGSEVLLELPAPKKRRVLEEARSSTVPKRTEVGSHLSGNPKRRRIQAGATAPRVTLNDHIVGMAAGLACVIHPCSDRSIDGRAYIMLQGINSAGTG